MPEERWAAAGERRPGAGCEPIPGRAVSPIPGGLGAPAAAPGTGRGKEEGALPSGDVAEPARGAGGDGAGPDPAQLPAAGV